MSRSITLAAVRLGSRCVWTTRSVVAMPGYRSVCVVRTYVIICPQCRAVAILGFAVWVSGDQWNDTNV